MSHDNEYYENMVTMLELIWGDGYMAPGGPGNVARLLRGIETSDKRILDIGCGIGGPVFEMAKTHGAEVVGIDLEAPALQHLHRVNSPRHPRAVGLYPQGKARGEGVGEGHEAWDWGHNWAQIEVFTVIETMLYHPLSSYC